MTTPASRHRKKVAAALQAAAAAPAQAQTGDQYLIMRAALTEDRRRLSDIQSIERKILVKAELLPNYQPYIDGVLEAGSGAQDEVLMTLMVWHLDVGEVERALEIAAYALKHELSAPDNYQRTPATIIAEEVAEHYLRLAANDEQLNAAVANLQLTQQLTAQHDMPDQVRAKLLKALGFATRDAGATKQALEALRRALELDERSGVKTELAKLEKQLENN